jgi:large subunit ribosomal protein L47
VDESMENLEEVVRERNRAFYELEVGISGEQEREIVLGPFGLEKGHFQREHVMPVWHNPRMPFHLMYRYRSNVDGHVRGFLRRYREKMCRVQTHWK